MKYRFAMISAIAIAIALSACDTFTETRYQISGTKPGAGQKEFSNDYVECQAVSSKINGYVVGTTVVACMQGKGWNVQYKETKHLSL